MCKVNELRLKEVINLKDGERLGFVSDLIFNQDTGIITHIVVPGPTGFLGFIKKYGDIEIAWNNIEKIGDDIIMVSIDIDHKR